TLPSSTSKKIGTDKLCSSQAHSFTKNQNTQCSPFPKLHYSFGKSPYILIVNQQKGNPCNLRPSFIAPTGSISSSFQRPFHQFHLHSCFSSNQFELAISLVGQSTTYPLHISLPRLPELPLPRTGFLHYQTLPSPVDVLPDSHLSRSKLGVVIKQ
ncbi:hypothetical protein ERO13_D05G135650v2, partial [Gossypium hirsutum]